MTILSSVSHEAARHSLSSSGSQSTTSLISVYSMGGSYHPFEVMPQSCSPFSGSRGTRSSLAHGHSLGTAGNSEVAREMGAPRIRRDLRTRCEVNMLRKLGG